MQQSYLIGMAFLIMMLLNPINFVKAENEQSLVGGLDHLALTVKNLEISTDFFVKQLSFKVIGEDEKYPAKFLNNGSLAITLWQSDKPHTVEFNRKNNVGLHHLALSVSSFEALDVLYQRIKTVDGIVVEFKPELFYGGPSKHMMIREPSGNRIEFIYRHQSN